MTRWTLLQRAFYASQAAADGTCWLRQARWRPHFADCLYCVVSKIFFPHLRRQIACGSAVVTMRAAGWYECASQEHGSV